MRLRRLLLGTALALSFAVSAPTVAKADPVTATIVAFAGFTGTAAAVATFVINTALYAAGSFALSKVSAALSGKNKAGIQERQASVTSLTLGEAPRELVIGEVCTAGTLVDAFNFGGKYGTDTVTRCVAVADHALDGVVGFYVDNQFYAWSGGGIIPGFSNKLSIRFYNATATGHDPQAHVLAAGAGWTTADRLAGMAVFWIDYQYDEKVWPQGHPQIKFVVRGLRVYDMRFDPAFGYSGSSPQTWANRASHTYNRNAALLRYAFQRGIYAEGHHGDPDYLLIGRGLTAEEAPPERIIAAANLCDETVDGEARYTANGVIRASDDFIAVEEMFAAAMAGQIVQREGGVEVEPGQAKAAAVTITDGALVVGEPVTFSAFLPDTDGGRINTVIPRYISPAQNWKDHSGPVRRSLADIAEDGGPREVTLPLLLVTSGTQADRCAEIARLAARLERRATIVLPPEYANLEEGDWIAWQSARHHGGAAVRYRIESWSLDEKWRMRLSLREIASSVYGVPDPIEDTAAIPPAPTPVDALDLDCVNAEPITLAGETSVMPAIRFTWDIPVDAAVSAIRAEVRAVGGTDIASTREDIPAKGVMIVTNGVGADQLLEARLVPLGDPTRPVLPSVWITVSTATLQAGDVSPLSPTIGEIKDDITAIFGDVFDLDAELATAAGLIASQGVEIAAARGGEASLASRIATVNAARVTGDEANATAIDLVEARTATAEADIIDLDIAIANETMARAQAISQIEARSGTNDVLDSEFDGYVAGSGSWTFSSNHSPTTGAANNPGYFSANQNALYSFMSGNPPAGVIADWQSVWMTAAEGVRYEGAAMLAVHSGAIGEVRLAFHDANKSIILAPVLGSGGRVGGGANGDPANFDVVGGFATAPAGTAFRRLLVRNQSPGGVSYTFMPFIRPYSRPATATQTVLSGYTEGASTELNATVSQNSLAIIDIELQQAIAVWQVKTAATGGKPAILELVSSSLGSFIALDAPQIFFGENTVFDDASDTFQTVTGGRRRVVANGAPFGASDDLIEWWGPSSIALGSMTTANGDNGRMTFAPYVFDNVVGPTPLGMTLTNDGLAQGTSAPGGGTAVSNNMVVTPVGNGSGSATIRFVKSDGDAGITLAVSGVGGNTAQFSGTVPSGGMLRAFYLAIVTSGSASVTRLIDVQLTDPL